MSMQTAMLAALILMVGVAQYGLNVQALRDLSQRPRVRGDNKALWALCILCIPIVGALLYNWMGPTSFVGRPTMQDGPAADHTPPPGSNITSIERARAARRGKPASTQAPPAPRQPGAPSRRSRTGS